MLEDFRPLMQPDHLIKGIVVTHRDRDTYTAIVNEVKADMILVKDIYGFNENRAEVKDLFARHIDFMVLSKLGFEKEEGAIGWRYPTHDDQLNVSVVRTEDKTWYLQLGVDRVQVEWVHQIQLVIWALTGLYIEPIKPPQSENEDDE